MSQSCACRGGVPCLFHYSELSLNRQLEVAHRLGIGDGVGSSDRTRSQSGRAERTADGRQPRGHERRREATDG